MNLSGSTSPAVGRARCPRCGRSFDCGMRNDAAECWCRSMPALPAQRLKAGSGCLCPECLAEEIARAQVPERDAGSVRD